MAIGIVFMRKFRNTTGTLPLVASHPIRRLLLVVSSAVLLGLPVMLSGCGIVSHWVSSEPATPVRATNNQQTQSVSGRYLQDGAILIARVAPPPSNPADKQYEGRIFGFMPSQVSIAGSWIKLSKSTGTIELMSGGRSVERFQAKFGISQHSALNSGVYSVVHKQKSPLWYAPDSYFTERGLAVPAQGERSRFRRGALGTAAIFIDASTPIHAGPLNSSEIGGIQISEEAMSRLYPTLNTGGVIVIE